MNQSNIPITIQFVDYLKKGFSLLDKRRQDEISDFIKSQQHINGGFIDRGGSPDLYYSLFGVWLSKALNLVGTLEKHKEYIQSFIAEISSPVERLSLFLIKGILGGNDFKRPSVSSLVKTLLRRGENINLSYRYFLFLLVYDTFYPANRIMLFIIKMGLAFFKPSNDIPCSISSALLVLRNKTGLKKDNEKEKLFSYFHAGKGFKQFYEIESADMLSTAVALFALKTSETDLRLVKPTCFDFIQKNYETGAFLSGDGDQTRDLEYTFYGLLALGALS